MKRSTALILTIVACLGLLLLLGHFRFGQHRDATNPKAQAVYAYVDVSDQSKDVLLLNASILFKVMESLPDNCEMTVIMFAHDYEILYTGAPIKNRGVFNTKIGQFLSKPSPSLRVPNTNTWMVFKHARDYNGDLPMSIVMIGDGGTEDRSSAAIASLRSLAQQVAANTKIKKVTFLGLLSEFRQEWNEWLSPLGNRKVVRGRNDFEQAAREVVRW